MAWFQIKVERDQSRFYEKLGTNLPPGNNKGSGKPSVLVPIKEMNWPPTFSLEVF